MSKDDIKSYYKVMFESLTTECQIETDDYPMLNPFLIPYFTNNRIDQEAERIWLEFLPEALSDPRKRNAKCLAERMGLSVVCLPLYKHRASDSLVQLVDTTFLVKKDDDPDEAEPQEVFVPANTIVINTNKVKEVYCDFLIFHECIHYYEHYLFFRLQEMHKHICMKTGAVSENKSGRELTHPNRY